MRLNVPQAADALRSGLVVAVPTITFYGLAADVRNPAAVARVFELKGRGPVPCPILVGSAARANGLLRAPPPKVAIALMEHFWPGGLTLVLGGADLGLPGVLRDGDGIGVRHDGHPTLLELLSLASCDVTGTSANLSGEPALSDGLAVSKQFAGRSGYAGHLSAPPTPGELPSTVLDTRFWPPKVLREGAVSKPHLAAFIATWSP